MSQDDFREKLRKDLRSFILNSFEVYELISSKKENTETNLANDDIVSKYEWTERAFIDNENLIGANNLVNYSEGDILPMIQNESNIEVELINKIENEIGRDLLNTFREYEIDVNDYKSRGIVSNSLFQLCVAFYIEYLFDNWFWDSATHQPYRKNSFSYLRIRSSYLNDDVIGIFVVSIDDKWIQNKEQHTSELANAICSHFEIFNYSDSVTHKGGGNVGPLIINFIFNGDIGLDDYNNLRKLLLERIILFGLQVLPDNKYFPEYLLFNNNIKARIYSDFFRSDIDLLTKLQSHLNSLFIFEDRFVMKREQGANPNIVQTEYLQRSFKFANNYLLVCTPGLFIESFNYAIRLGIFKTTKHGITRHFSPQDGRPFRDYIISIKKESNDDYEIRFHSNDPYNIEQFSRLFKGVIKIFVSIKLIDSRLILDCYNQNLKVGSFIINNLNKEEYFHILSWSDDVNYKLDFNLVKFSLDSQ